MAMHYMGRVDGHGYDGQQKTISMFVDHLKHIQASFLRISINWLSLQVAKLPRRQDVMIFIVTTNR